MPLTFGFDLRFKVDRNSHGLLPELFRFLFRAKLRL
jgi:hypothetical protein